MAASHPPEPSSCSAVDKNMAVSIPQPSDDKSDDAQASVLHQETHASSPITIPPDPPQPTTTHPGITNRQFYMMATTSTIGAGLFLATFQALQHGGPGALVLAFAVLGFAVWSTMCALGELSAAFPTRGSFYDFSVRFVSPALGFALGWNYVVNFMLAIPLELTVMVLLTRYWGGGGANADANTAATADAKPDGAVLLPVFLAGLGLVSACGSRWYAEFENVFAAAKLLVIAMFSVTACIILASGGGGGGGGVIPAATEEGGRQIGTALWKGTGNNDGAFRNGASGAMFAFSLAAVAFGGTEMLGLMASECRRPAKIMPVGSKIVAGRIVLVYILPLLLLGLIVTIPPTSGVKEEEAAGTPGHAKQQQVLTSPFILAISQAKIPVLPDIMNGIVLVAVFSMANACVFTSSRALAAICRKGMGPRLLSTTFTRADLSRALKKVFAARKRQTPTGGVPETSAETNNRLEQVGSGRNQGLGQPLYAIGICFVIALLAFVAASPKATDIFDWLLALAGMSNYLTWSSICLSHIRMRRAFRKQGRDIDEVVQWKSPVGIAGSVIALVIFGFGVVCQMYTAVMPPGDNGVAQDKAKIAKGFLGLVTCVGCWAGYQWCKGEGRYLIPLAEIDLCQEVPVTTTQVDDVEQRGAGVVSGTITSVVESADVREVSTSIVEVEKDGLGEGISQVGTRNSSIGTVSALTFSRNTAQTTVAYV